MNCKKLLLLLLAGVFCFSLAGCSRGDEVQEPSRKDFAAMSDEETVEALLSDYNMYAPASYSLTYEMKTRIADAETFVSGTSSRTGNGASLSFVESAGEGNVTRSDAYEDGIFYSSGAEGKVKFAVDKDGAWDLIPWYGTFFFDNINDFADKSLLRSEDGSYLVVLSSPSDTFLNSSRMVSEALGAEAPREVYLVLHFSADGVPSGASMGYDLTVDFEGVEVSASVRVDWTMVTTDTSQITVAAPEDADSYKETDPPSSDTDDNSETADGE